MRAFVLIKPALSPDERNLRKLQQAFDDFAWVEDTYIVRGEGKEGKSILLLLRFKQKDFDADTLRQRIASALGSIGDFEVWNIVK